MFVTLRDRKMDKLTLKQQEEAKLNSTERLLCKAGLDEEAVFNMHCDDLLDALARLMLNPTETHAAAVAVTTTDAELGRQEPRMRKQELQWQKEQLKLQQEADEKRY